MPLHPPGRPVITDGQSAIRSNDTIPQPAPSPSPAGAGLEVYRKPKFTHSPGLDFSQVGGPAFEQEREASIRQNEQRAQEDFALGRDYQQRQERDALRAQREQEAAALQQQKDAAAQQKLNQDSLNFEFEKMATQLGRKTGVNPATGAAEFLDSDDDWQAQRAAERQKRIDTALAAKEKARTDAITEKWTAAHGQATAQYKRAKAKREELEDEAKRSVSYDASKPYDAILDDVATDYRGKALEGSAAGLEAIAKRRHPEKAGWLGIGDENAEARARTLADLRGQAVDLTPDEEAELKAANPEAWKTYETAKGKATVYKNASAAEKKWQDALTQLDLVKATGAYELEDAELANMRARRDNGELANKRASLDAQMANAKAQYERMLANREAAYRASLHQGMTADELSAAQFNHQMDLMQRQQNYLNQFARLEAEDEKLDVELADFNRLLDRAERREKGLQVGEPPALPLGPGAQNEGWQPFPPESQTLGIPREEMPQVRADHRGALAQYLRGQGVKWRDEEVLPSALKPSQEEFSPEKVQKAKEHTGGDRAVIVSKDGYVIDGHHQWMAAQETKPGEKIRIYRLDKNAAEALEIVKGFPSATTSKESTPSATVNQADDRSDRDAFQANPARQELKAQMDAIQKRMSDPVTSMEEQKRLGDELRALQDRYWQDDPAGEIEAAVSEWRETSAPRARAIQEQIDREMLQEGLTPEDAVVKERELLAQMDTTAIDERFNKVVTRELQAIAKQEQEGKAPSFARLQQVLRAGHRSEDAAEFYRQVKAENLEAATAERKAKLDAVASTPEMQRVIGALQAKAQEIAGDAKVTLMDAVTYGPRAMMGDGGLADPREYLKTIKWDEALKMPSSVKSDADLDEHVAALWANVKPVATPGVLGEWREALNRMGQKLLTTWWPFSQKIGIDQITSAKELYVPVQWIMSLGGIQNPSELSAEDGMMSLRAIGTKDGVGVRKLTPEEFAHVQDVAQAVKRQIKWTQAIQQVFEGGENPNTGQMEGAFPLTAVEKHGPEFNIAGQRIRPFNAVRMGVEQVPYFAAMYSKAGMGLTALMFADEEYNRIERELPNTSAGTKLAISLVTGTLQTAEEKLEQMLITKGVPFRGSGKLSAELLKMGKAGKVIDFSRRVGTGMAFEVAQEGLQQITPWLVERGFAMASKEVKDELDRVYGPSNSLEEHRQHFMEQHWAPYAKLQGEMALSFLPLVMFGAGVQVRTAGQQYHAGKELQDDLKLTALGVNPEMRAEILKSNPIRAYEIFSHLANRKQLDPNSPEATAAIRQLATDAQSAQVAIDHGQEAADAYSAHQSTWGSGNAATVADNLTKQARAKDPTAPRVPVEPLQAAMAFAGTPDVALPQQKANEAIEALSTNEPLEDPASKQNRNSFIAGQYRKLGSELQQHYANVAPVVQEVANLEAQAAQALEAANAAGDKPAIAQAKLASDEALILGASAKIATGRTFNSLSQEEKDALQKPKGFRNRNAGEMSSDGNWIVSDAVADELKFKAPSSEKFLGMKADEARKFFEGRAARREVKLRQRQAAQEAAARGVQQQPPQQAQPAHSRMVDSSGNHLTMSAEDIQAEVRHQQPQVQTAVPDPKRANQSALTPEAQALLADIDSGNAAPAFISKNLRRIAKENGVAITKQDTPADVIEKLRAKAQAVNPAYPASEEQVMEQTAENRSWLFRTADEWVSTHVTPEDQAFMRKQLGLGGQSGLLHGISFIAHLLPGNPSQGIRGVIFEAGANSSPVSYSPQKQAIVIRPQSFDRQVAWGKARAYSVAIEEALHHAITMAVKAYAKRTGQNWEQVFRDMWRALPKPIRESVIASYRARVIEDSKGALSASNFDEKAGPKKEELDYIHMNEFMRMYLMREDFRMEVAEAIKSNGSFIGKLQQLIDDVMRLVTEWIADPSIPIEIRTRWNDVLNEVRTSEAYQLLLAWHQAINLGGMVAAPQQTTQPAQPGKEAPASPRAGPQANTQEADENSDGSLAAAVKNLVSKPAKQLYAQAEKEIERLMPEATPEEKKRGATIAAKLAAFLDKAWDRIATDTGMVTFRWATQGEIESNQRPMPFSIRKDPRNGHRLVINLAALMAHPNGHTEQYLSAQIRVQVAFAKFFLKNLGDPQNAKQALKWAPNADVLPDLFREINLAQGDAKGKRGAWNIIAAGIEPRLVESKNLRDLQVGLMEHLKKEKSGSAIAPQQGGELSAAAQPRGEQPQLTAFRAKLPQLVERQLANATATERAKANAAGQALADVLEDKWEHWATMTGWKGWRMATPAEMAGKRRQMPFSVDKANGKLVVNLPRLAKEDRANNPEYLEGQIELMALATIEAKPSEERKAWELNFRETMDAQWDALFPDGELAGWRFGKVKASREASAAFGADAVWFDIDKSQRKLVIDMGKLVAHPRSTEQGWIAGQIRLAANFARFEMGQIETAADAIRVLDEASAPDLPFLLREIARRFGPKAEWIQIAEAFGIETEGRTKLEMLQVLAKDLKEEKEESGQLYSALPAREVYAPGEVVGPFRTQEQAEKFAARMGHGSVVQDHDGDYAPPQLWARAQRAKAGATAFEMTTPLGAVAVTQLDRWIAEHHQEVGEEGLPSPEEWHIPGLAERARIHNLTWLRRHLEHGNSNSHDPITQVVPVKLIGAEPAKTGGRYLIFTPLLNTSQGDPALWVLNRNPRKFIRVLEGQVVGWKIHPHESAALSGQFEGQLSPQDNAANAREVTWPRDEHGVIEGPDAHDYYQPVSSRLAILKGGYARPMRANAGKQDWRWTEGAPHYGVRVEAPAVAPSRPFIGGTSSGVMVNGKVEGPIPNLEIAQEYAREVGGQVVAEHEGPWARPGEGYAPVYRRWQKRQINDRVRNAPHEGVSEFEVAPPSVDAMDSLESAYRARATAEPVETEAIRKDRPKKESMGNVPGRWVQSRDLGAYGVRFDGRTEGPIRGLEYAEAYAEAMGGEVVQGWEDDWQRPGKDYKRIYASMRLQKKKGATQKDKGELGASLGSPETPLDRIMSPATSSANESRRNILQANASIHVTGRTALAEKAIFGRSLGNLSRAPRPQESDEVQQVLGLLNDARENGYLHHGTPFGTLQVLEDTSEHAVAFDEESQRWIKSTLPGGYGIIARVEGDELIQGNGTPAEYLTRLRLQNEYFEDDLKVVSVWQPLIQRGGRSVPGLPSIVISQPHIAVDVTSMDEDKLREAMRGNGYVELKGLVMGDPAAMAFYDPVKHVLIMDIKPANAVVGENGKLAVIDAVMQFATPEIQDVLPRYTGELGAAILRPETLEAHEQLGRMAEGEAVAVAPKKHSANRGYYNWVSEDAEPTGEEQKRLFRLLDGLPWLGEVEVSRGSQGHLAFDGTVVAGGGARYYLSAILKDKTLLIADMQPRAQSPRRMQTSSAGMELMAEFAVVAAANGIETLTTTGARGRGIGGAAQTGYFAWATLGFELDDPARAQRLTQAAPANNVMPEITPQEAAEMAELMGPNLSVVALTESTRGRNLYRRHGVSEYLRFDLTPGSPGIRRLFAHLDGLVRHTDRIRARRPERNRGIDGADGANQGRGRAPGEGVSAPSGAESTELSAAAQAIDEQNAPNLTPRGRMRVMVPVIDELAKNLGLDQKTVRDIGIEVAKEYKPEDGPLSQALADGLQWRLGPVLEEEAQYGYGLLGAARALAEPPLPPDINATPGTAQNAYAWFQQNPDAPKGAYFKYLLAHTIHRGKAGMEAPVQALDLVYPAWREKLAEHGLHFQVVKYPFADADAAVIHHDPAKLAELVRILQDPRAVPNYHRRLGELFGFKESEIDAFVSRRGEGNLGMALPAHHGTPHEVDEFTTEKVGTGQGGKSHGWGLYFAEHENAANTYTLGTPLIDGQPYDPENVIHMAAMQASQSGATPAQIAQNLRSSAQSFRQFANDANAQETARKYEAAADSLEAGTPLPPVRYAGNVYSVSLDVEPEELLEWGKPLEQQSAKVRQAIEAAGIKPPAEDEPWTHNAEQARALQRAGIPGLRFLNDGRRGGGAGTWNYVIWDESKISIAQKNVEAPAGVQVAPLNPNFDAETPGELGAAMMRGDDEGAGGASPAPDTFQAELDRFLEDMDALVFAEDPLHAMYDRQLDEAIAGGHRNNPRYANPVGFAAGRTAFDVSAEGIRAGVTPEDIGRWEQQGRDFVREMGGAKKAADEIIAMTLRGEALTAGQTRGAMQISNQLWKDALASGDPQEIRRAREFTWSYVNARTANARALAAGRDPHKTPTERNLEYLTYRLTKLPKDAEKRIEKAGEAGSRYKSKAEALEAEQSAQWARLVEELNLAGLSLADIFQGEAISRLRASRQVQQVIDAVGNTTQERLAMRMILNGESTADILAATNLRAARVNEIEDAFDAAILPVFERWTELGITLANFQDQAAPPAENQLSSGAITNAPAMSKAQTNARAILQALKPRRHVRNAGRVRKVKSGSPATGQRFNLENQLDVIRVGRLMQTATADAYDILEEMWRNNVLSGLVTHTVNVSGTWMNVLFTYGLQRPVEAMINKVRKDPNSPQGLKEYLHIMKAILPAIKEELHLANVAFDTEYAWVDASKLDEPITIEEVAEKGHGKVAISEQMFLQLFGRSAWPRFLKVRQETLQRLRDAGVDPAVAEQRAQEEAQKAVETSFGYTVQKKMDELGVSRVLRGRVIRLNQRIMLWEDQVGKAIIARMEVAAFGYRIAKREGLEGDALAARMVELLKPGSEAWVQAIETARKATFTQELLGLDEGGNIFSATAKAMGRLRNMRTTHPAWRFAQFLYRMVFPFVNTPFLIADRAMQWTPLNTLAMGTQWLFGGARGMMSGALDGFTDGPLGLAKGGLVGLKDGLLTTTATKAQQVTQMANLGIAWAITAALIQGAEGDDEDPDKWFWISGSHASGAESRGERELHSRTEGSPMTIRLLGHSFYYGRLDPIAITLAMQVDAIREVKKGIKGKSSMQDVLDSIMGYWLTQPTEKTFFVNFKKLTAILDSFTPGAVPGEKQRAIGDLFNGMLSGLIPVPNLVRQPFRQLDDHQRDYRSQPWIYKNVLPYGGWAEPKVDLLGNYVMREHSGSHARLQRALFASGFKPSSNPNEPFDDFLRAFDLTYPDLPEGINLPAEKTTYKYRDAKGQETNMTPQEITRFKLEAGRRIRERSRRMLSFRDLKHPTEEKMKDLLRMVSDIRSDIRSEMFPSHRKWENLSSEGRRRMQAEAAAR